MAVTTSPHVELARVSIFFGNFALTSGECADRKDRCGSDQHRDFAAHVSSVAHNASVDDALGNFDL